MEKTGAPFKIWCFILAFAVFVAATPVVTTAADGSSEALALGVSNPVEFEEAMEDDSVTYIRILSDLTTTPEAWAGAGVPKIILGTPGATLTMPPSGMVTLNADTTFKNLSLELVHTIAADGNRLIFDTGTELLYPQPPEPIPMILGGGYNQDCYSDTFIQAKSGNFQGVIIAGSYEGSTYGDCSVEIGGTATTKSILGGNEGGPCVLTGSVTVKVGGGSTVDGTIHGGTGYSNNNDRVGVYGHVLIDISGQSKVTGNIFGARRNTVGYKEDDVTYGGGVTINIRDSAQVQKSVYGGPEGLGSNSAVYGGTAVNILDRATVLGDVYGGGSNDTYITVDGGTRITVADGATVTGTIAGSNHFTGSNSGRNVLSSPKLLVLEGRGTGQEFLPLPSFREIETVSAASSYLQLHSTDGDSKWKRFDLTGSSLRVTGETELPNPSLSLQNSGLVLTAGSRFSAAAIEGGGIAVTITGTPENTTITAPGIVKTQFLPPPGYSIDSSEDQPADTVTFLAKILASIAVETEPHKRTYYINEELDLSGGRLRLIYQDGGSELIEMTDSAVTPVYDFSNPGPSTVELTYRGFSASFPVEVTEKEAPQKEVTSISVDTLPAKTTYRMGDSLDLTGGRLKLIHQGTPGAREEIIGYIAMDDAAVTVNPPPDFSTIGIKTIQLHYLGFSAAFTVEVTEVETPKRELASISVATYPTKTAYQTGEYLDLDGGTLNLHYTDNTNESIPMTNPHVTTDYDFSTPGIKTVRLRYLGFSVDFTVTVTQREAPQKEPVSISILQTPAKLEYQVDEPLDLSGGSIRLTYSDGTVSDSSMTSDAFSREHESFSSPGLKAVTITYRPVPTLTASFQVEVAEPDPVDPPPPTPNPNPLPPVEKQDRENGTTQPDPAKYFRIATNRPITLGEAKTRWEAALTSREGNSPIVMRFVNKSHISPDVLCSISNWSAESGIPAVILADTVESGVLTHRMMIDPALASGTVLLTASSRTYEAARTKSIFHSFYRNDLQVIQLSQPGSFGGEATVYTKWELAASPPQSLHLYLYDPGTNEFRKLNSSECRVTAAGYVYFKTGTGGCIVISSGELARR